MRLLAKRTISTLSLVAIVFVTIVSFKFLNVEHPSHGAKQRKLLSKRGYNTGNVPSQQSNLSFNASTTDRTDTVIPEGAPTINSSLLSCKNGSRKNLMFLKTHKTGSSTLQNIIVRKAYKMNAFIGLPARDILFEYMQERRFKKVFMKKTPANRTVNMLVHHMIFNKSEVQKVLPPDSIYITILRDPVTQFESVFNYLRNDVAAFRKVHKSMGIGEFLNRPGRYYRGRSDGQLWWFGKNNMMFDFGFNNTIETDAYITKSIQEIEDAFHLVMIAEYFEMSVLLMRELLCWSMEDIVYLTMNSRSRSGVEKMTIETKNRILEWNKADVKLYQHFNRTFWRKVREYGTDRMKNDLIKLEALIKKVSKLCVESDQVSSKKVKNRVYKMFTPRNGVDITQYVLKPNATKNGACIGMVLPEVSWYQKFNTRQYPSMKKVALKQVIKLVPPHARILTNVYKRVNS